jgi:hypothetical protein
MNTQENLCPCYRHDEIKPSVNEKDRLSRAIHAASVVAGYPEDEVYISHAKEVAALIEEAANQAPVAAK